MKRNRLFSLLCLILIMSLLVAVSGCGTSPATTTKTGNETTQPQNQTTGPSTSETTKGQTTAGSDDKMVLIDALQHYIDVKQACYEAIAAKIENDPSQAASIIGLMGIATMDMSLLPVTYLAGLQALQDATGWSGNLLLVKGTGKIEKKGNKFVFEATIEDTDNPFSIQGEYDRQTDSMQYTMKQGDQDSIYFEFVRSGDGYASQYFMFPASGDTPNDNLIKVFVIGTDIYVGYKDLADKPQPIYGTTPAVRKDFITGCPTTYVMEDDKVTVVTEP
jgi:hypothetical protein